MKILLYIIVYHPHDKHSRIEETLTKPLLDEEFNFIAQCQASNSFNVTSNGIKKGTFFFRTK